MRPLRPNLSATSLIRDTKKANGTRPQSHWDNTSIPLTLQTYPFEIPTLSHWDAIDNRALKEQKVNAQPYIPIQWTWMHYRWKNTSLPILQIDDFKSALFQVLHLDFPVI